MSIIEDLGKRDCVEMIEKLCDIKIGGDEEEVINGIMSVLMGGELIRDIFEIKDEDFERWSCEGVEGVKDKINKVIGVLKG